MGRRPRRSRDPLSRLARLRGVLVCLLLSAWPVATHAATEVLTWANADYNFRARITLDGGACGVDCLPATDLSNFPVLVTVTCGTTLDCATLQPSCNDLVFYDADQTTPLAFTREATCTRVVGTSNAYWVKIPTINTGLCTGGTRAGLACALDTDCAGGGTCTGAGAGPDRPHVWMYWSNPTATDQQNAAAVWDSSYALVWHFPSGPSLTAYDDTGYNRDATAISASLTTGTVGGGALTGPYAVIDRAPVTGLPGSTAPRTLSLWAKFAANENISIAGWGGNGTNGQRWALGYASNHLYVPEGTNAFCSFAWSYDTSWQYLTAVLPSGATNFNQALSYRNGALQQTTCTDTPLATSVTQPFTVGSLPTNTTAPGDEAWFTGAVDEVRISTVARTATWIKAEYDSMRADCGGASCLLSVAAATALVTPTVTHTPVPTTTPTPTPNLGTSTPTVTPPVGCCDCGADECVPPVEVEGTPTCPEHDPTCTYIGNAVCD